MNLTAGATLQNGKYLINHIVCQRGLSLTLQGTQLPDHRSVVLKTLNVDAIAESELSSVKQRFVEQVEQFSNCQHPRLERIVGFFEEDQRPFVVVEAVSGCTLAERVQAIGMLSEGQAIQYVQQVGAALTAVHQRGLLHREVTPQNIVCLEPSDTIMLTNCGLAHPIVLGWSDGFAHPPAAEYAAIEQYQAQLTPTPATDVYSLAGVLYFLVTGHAPTAAPLRHSSPLPPPTKFCPGLSASIEAAILKGLELNPQHRSQTVALWLAQLGHPMGQSVHDATLAIGLETSANGLSSSTILSSTSLPTSGEHTKDDQTLALKPLIGQPVKQITKRSKENPSAPLAAMAKSLSGSSRSSQPSSRRKFSKTLLSVGLTASAVGLGFGLLLRLAAGSTGAGSSFFNAEQSFPVMRDWPGASVPAATVPPVMTKPKDSPRSRPRSQPEVSPPVESAAPPPQIEPPSVRPVPSPAVEKEGAPPPATNPSPLPVSPPPANTAPVTLPPSLEPSPPPASAEPTPPASMPRQETAPKLNMGTP
jgi:eukaryotic-like serine/threonine-protein kinase